MLACYLRLLLESAGPTFTVASPCGAPHAHVATSLLLRPNIQRGTTLITPTSHCALIFSRRTGSCIELPKLHCSATYNTGAARIFTRKQCSALRQQHLKQNPPLPVQFEQRFNRKITNSRIAMKIADFGSAC